LQGYALTECCSYAIRQIDLRGPPQSVGLPAPHTIVDIVDINDANVSLPPGEVGEICISGPQVMLGYLNDVDEKGTMLRNGKLHTGDLGYMDSEGYVTIVDRKKDVVFVGGNNVFPSHVEKTLRQRLPIQDACVVPIPDDSLFGYRLKAFVIPRGK